MAKPVLVFQTTDKGKKLAPEYEIWEKIFDLNMVMLTTVLEIRKKNLVEHFQEQ